MLNNLRTLLNLFAIGCMCLAASSATAAIEYDQNVTPDVIFGSGNANGGFTTSRSNGVEVGLRAKQRFPPANIFNSNGDGTYSFATGPGTGTAPRPLWNFEWSVNTDYDGSTALNLADLTYQLRIDYDPSQGTNNFQTFDPIGLLPFDNAFGDNSTGNGGGTEGTASNYLSMLANNNVAQNSWSMTFFDGPSYPFDPDVDGTYTIELDAILGGVVQASSSIDVIVGLGGAAVPEPTAFLTWACLGLCGTAATRRRRS